MIFYRRSLQTPGIVRSLPVAQGNRGVTQAPRSIVRGGDGGDHYDEQTTDCSVGQCRRDGIGFSA
jgi:hypothetical protein